MPSDPITPIGLQNLQEEYRTLKTVERPEIVETVHWAAGNGDRSENGDYIYGKKRLREIDKRLKFIGQRLDKITVVDPCKLNFSHVEFGATVHVIDENGEEKVFTIVGEDESDAKVGKISWKSPVAKALLKKEAGDWVSYQTPRGERELEINSIEYKQVI